MSYAHLGRDGRYVIAHLLAVGLSVREIGRRVERSEVAVVRLDAHPSLDPVLDIGGLQPRLRAKVRTCVHLLRSAPRGQQRLARSVGEKPTEAKDRSLVAWMAERRETDALKPIDESCHGQRSESAGRNISECIVASSPRMPGSRVPGVGAKAAGEGAARSSSSPPGGVVAAAR
jgi:hypothetical protein